MQAELVLYNLCLIACIGTVTALLFNRLQPGRSIWTISVSVTVLLLVLVSVTALLGWNAAEEKLYQSILFISHEYLFVGLYQLKETIGKPLSGR